MDYFERLKFVFLRFKNISERIKLFSLNIFYKANLKDLKTNK
jgi:hypothetical protein